MDLESLKTKVTEVGRTQFSALSERTVDHMLNREIARNSNDEYYTEEVINSIVADLKELDGNIHFEVGRHNNDYKTNFEREWKKNHPEVKTPTTDDEDKFTKLLAKIEEQGKKITEMEAARTEADKKAEKNKVMESVKRSIRAKFNQAGVEENAYILKQTLRDLEIPDTNANVAELAKALETAYYQNLKEAGFETEQPRFGGQGGGRGKTAADDFFARKAKKEGWGKE